MTELAAHHTLDDLRKHITAIQDQLQAYRDVYGTNDPRLVDAREAADATTGVDEVWGDLADWMALEDELRLHERAHRHLTERPHFAAIQS